MSLRREFVLLAQQPGVNRRALCRRFGISPKTGYKWLARAAVEGAGTLQNRSRRPHRSPRRTGEAMEAAVVAARLYEPSWGGRKLQALLRPRNGARVPAPSTIAAILRRHGVALGQLAAPSQPFQAFEHPSPNALWQMDFKGHFALHAGGRCHALSVLDDHSRFLVGLTACGDERGTTVQAALSGIFARYGLPERMLMDNGPPWGSDAQHRHTPLTAWLMRLGIAITHGRPYHPQTQGKVERFHRTVQLELLRTAVWRDLAHCQARFDPWRERYNCVRPHEALGSAVPATRYRPSPRSLPAALPPIEYPPGDEIRRVHSDGHISFHGATVLVSKAFQGQPVGLRPTDTDGCFDVYFCQFHVHTIDLRNVRQ